MTKTCEERINEHLDNLLRSVRKGLEDESEREELLDGILSVDTFITKKVLLSWGGPSDFLLVHIDPESGDITQVEYHFQDWFDGASRQLTGADLETVANFFDWLCDVPGRV